MAVVENFAKKKFSKVKQEVQPWKLKLLSDSPSSVDEFQHLNEFSLYQGISSATTADALHFPEYLLYSQNYFHTKWAWGLKNHRKLKNVIVVLEYVPDVNACKVGLTSDGSGPSLTAAQSRSLQRAFDLLDMDNNRQISSEELPQLLSAVNVPAEPEDINGWMQTLSLDGDSSLSFDEVVKMFEMATFAQIESGRYFMAVSLEEVVSK